MKIVSERGTSLIYLNPGMWCHHWDMPEVWNRDLSGGEQEVPRQRHLDKEVEDILEGVPAGVLHLNTIITDGGKDEISRKLLTSSGASSSSNMNQNHTINIKTKLNSTMVL